MSYMENPKKSNFVLSSTERERGEIERVATTFSEGHENEFIERFMLALQSASLVPLSEDVWGKLENSDSFPIQNGDWETVRSLAEQVNRDWNSLKEKMENGTPLDAPIILKIKDNFYLVSGNTRLMIARALGITPEVVLVDISI
jgi:hypothetical protein